MTINDMKQYRKNLELTVDVYNDIKKRANNAGYQLFSENTHIHYKCERGGWWLHRTQIWINTKKKICVTINWSVWSWGSDHPKKYDFNGHIMTDDELYGRA